jgi:hypothetical protein
MQAVSPRSRFKAFTKATSPLVTLSVSAIIVAVLPTMPTTLTAQVVAANVIPAKEVEAKPVTPPALFESIDPVEVTFVTNIGKLRGDKGDDAPWRPGTFSYKGTDGTDVAVPMRAHTRGIWRLKMCDFPPLRLNFAAGTSRGSIFEHLDKPKLVSYCQDTDAHEEYVLQEFQLYRIYQLLTPVSHKARLLKFDYVDSASRKTRARRYGFVLEEPKALAGRVGAKVLDQTGALPGDVEPFQEAIFGIFQYMIGNTDFAHGALHNVELFIQPDGTVLPVAYDFDFAGAVNARYAVVDESLHLVNVRQRLFRGFCVDDESFAKGFALFREKKDAIYALYDDPIGKLMDRGTVKETLHYFDDFYKDIKDARSASRITKGCLRRPK